MTRTGFAARRERLQSQSQTEARQAWLLFLARAQQHGERASRGGVLSLDEKRELGALARRVTTKFPGGRLDAEMLGLSSLSVAEALRVAGDPRAVGEVLLQLCRLLDAILYEHARALARRIDGET